MSDNESSSQRGRTSSRHHHHHRSRRDNEAAHRERHARHNPGSDNESRSGRSRHHNPLQEPSNEPGNKEVYSRPHHRRHGPDNEEVYRQRHAANEHAGGHAARVASGHAHGYHPHHSRAHEGAVAPHHHPRVRTHDRGPKHYGDHDRDHGTNVPSEWLVVRPDGLWVSAPNVFTGERSLHHPANRSLPSIVLHEDQGTPVTTMLSPRLMRTMSDALAPHGFIILISPELRMTNDGTFAGNEAQSMIGGPTAFVDNYLADFGLALVPHSQVQSDLAQSAQLQEQEEIALVIRHTEDVVQRYHRTNDGEELAYGNLYTLGSPVSERALDSNNEFAMHLRSGAHTTLNEEHHAQGMQRLANARGEVQDLLDHHRHLVEAGHIPRNSSDVLLEHWEEHFMPKVAATMTEGEQKQIYETLQKDIAHYKETGRPAVTVLETIRQRANEVGGTLQHLWNKFAQEHVEATLKVFGHYLEQMLANLPEAAASERPEPGATRPPPRTVGDAEDLTESESEYGFGEDDDDAAAAMSAGAAAKAKPKRRASGVHKAAQQAAGKLKAGAEKAVHRVRERLSKLRERVKDVEGKSTNKKYDAAAVEQLARRLLTQHKMQDSREKEEDADEKKDAAEKKEGGSYSEE